MKKLMTVFFLLSFGMAFYSTLSSFEKTCRFEVEEIQELVEIEENLHESLILDPLALYFEGSEVIQTAKIPFSKSFVFFIQEIFLQQPYSPPE